MQRLNGGLHAYKESAAKVADRFIGSLVRGRMLIAAVD